MIRVLILVPFVAGAARKLPFISTSVVVTPPKILRAIRRILRVAITRTDKVSPSSNSICVHVSRSHLVLAVSEWHCFGLMRGHDKALHKWSPE